MTDSKKLILDLDTGIDDTLAIAYALGSPDAELIGITGTYGNVTVEQGVRNALAVTELFGRADIPVYRGVDHPISVDPCNGGDGTFTVSRGSAFIHGGNGIGEVKIPDPTRETETQTSVDFIIDAAETYGKDLWLVPTGAMTTIAAVLEREPRVKDMIGGIVMMGGALTVPGNVNAWTEANIAQDPEAADRIFRSGAHVTMIGLDVTMQTLLTKRETTCWRATGTPAGRFLADMTDYYIDAYAVSAPGMGGCGLHDPLAVAVALDPTLVTTLPINLKADLDGPTRGRTIGDYDRLNTADKTVDAAVGVDVRRFLGEFMARVGAVASGSGATA